MTVTGEPFQPAWARGDLFAVTEPNSVPTMEGMTSFEIALGYVLGVEERGAEPSSAAHGSVARPLDTLTTVLTEALERPPCVIAFSGGRDSSLLLAVAARTARAEGLPLPVPATKRFPAVTESLEDEWQERVIRHLDVPDWVRIDLNDELDAIGPTARAFLSSHGVVWPPMQWTNWPFARLAHGGTLVLGDGGDEILGARRVRPVANLLAQHSLGWEVTRRSAGALAPKMLRRLLLRRRYTLQSRLPWLRPDALDEAVRRLADQALDEPLRWDRSIGWELRVRAQAVGLRNAQRLAAGASARLSAPLLDPRVIDAIARAHGALGPLSRTAALRAHFGGLLPDEVLARQTKARFNRTWFAEHTRSFVERWDGHGLDDALVDPEALRTEWSRPAPHAMTAALLQSAWLAGEAK